MKATSAKVKYKSSVNLFLAIFMVLFQIVVLLLLTSPIFASSKLGLNWGIFLGIVDAVLCIPMFFLVRYELRSDCVYISDYPFGAYKIPYADFLAVDDEKPEKEEKHLVKKVGLSTNYMVLTYRKLKRGKYETRYMLISPAEKEDFVSLLKHKLKQEGVSLEKKATTSKEESNVKSTKEKEPDKIEKKQSALKSKAQSQPKKPQPSSLETKKKETKKPIEEKTPPESTSKKETLRSEEVVEPISAQPTSASNFFTVEEEEEKPN